LLGFLRGFRQKPPLDHLLHIGAGQRQLGFEAALDLAEVVSLLKLHLSEHPFQIGLGGDEHRGPAVGGGGQTLHHGLQVEQAAAFLTDELAGLIHKEVEPEAGFLLIEILPHPIRKAFD